ncbi:MAG TPA: leucine-rich repeat domain-containing protein, partial [Candidatus Hydrogenedentes bacterium]|nr:leucine-rich repeat domain-containing protein [Candidatus Hydrogenedentota bacterium]
TEGSPAEGEGEGEGEGTSEGEGEGGGEGEEEGEEEGEAPCDATMTGSCGGALTPVQPEGQESGTVMVTITAEAYDRMISVTFHVEHTVANPASAYLKTGDTVLLDLGDPSSPINYVCTEEEIEAISDEDNVYFEITSGQPPVSILTGAPDCEGPDSVVLSGPMYVDKNNTSEWQNGMCWETAFTEIQPAIEWAALAEGGQVWVAQGVYDGDNTSVVRMRSNVEVFGGFTGTETALEERDWNANLTILDGYNSQTGERAEHVVMGENIQNARLDGFVITNGGGMPESMDEKGGGVYLSEVDDTMVLSHLTVTANMGLQGAGAYLADSSPAIEDSRWVLNFGMEGAGLYLDHASPTVDNVLFLGNVAATFFAPDAGDGGAVYATNDSAPVLTNTTLAAHWSRDGAIHVASGQTVTPQLVNTVMWYNTPKDVTGNINATYTLSQDDLSGTGNLYRNPLFAIGAKHTFTSDATYDEVTDRTTYYDSTQYLTPGALAGAIVQVPTCINEMQGFPFHVVVLDNTATSFEVARDLHEHAIAGAEYRFLDGSVVAGSGAIDTGTSAGAPVHDFLGHDRGYDGDGLGQITGDNSDFDLGYLEYRGVLSGVIDFMDSKLEYAILSLLPNFGSPIYVEDAFTVTELDLSWRNINQLDGLEYFVNLKKLKLSGNKVSNLEPLANLTNLDELDLCYNEITDITPLRYLRNLKKLSLCYNHINDLSPLAELTKLEYLELGFGDPTVDDQNVDMLATGTNDVSDITPLASLKKLEYLNLGGNTSLTEISTLSGITSLETVWLASNPITSFDPIKYLTNLNTLGIVHGGFGNSDVAFAAPLTGLDAITLMSNETLSDITGLYQGGEVEGETILSNSMNPKTVNFANCPISDFSIATHWSDLCTVHMDETLVTNLNSLAGLDHLNHVSFDNCMLTDISGLAGCSSIQNLNLRNNAIANISALADAVNIQNLRLDNNQITDIQALVDNAGLGENDHCNIIGNPLTNYAACTELSALRTHFSNPNYVQSDAVCRSAVTLTITIIGRGSTFPEPGIYTYAQGSRIWVNAYPVNGSGYAFEQWRGDVTSDNPDQLMTLYHDISIEAVFTNSGYFFHTLTIQQVGNGQGAISPGVGGFTYINDRYAGIVANPSSGSGFGGWSGDITSMCLS